MDKLTKQDSYGWYVIYDEFSIKHRGEDVDRLAAYESTNLTPSDIADLRNFACQLCGRYKTAHEGSCDNCRWRAKV